VCSVIHNIRSSQEIDGDFNIDFRGLDQRFHTDKPHIKQKKPAQPLTFYYYKNCLAHPVNNFVYGMEHPKVFFSKPIKQKNPNIYMLRFNSNKKLASTYSPGFDPSTIGGAGLNCSVRNGKRCSPALLTP
jgi:hypothetical protein